jgi:ubiquinone/menaquinone biosynthesis C-methylase UbiE
LLGDVRGLEVLYAGGSSPLWVEGLSQRIGGGGTLVAVDLDAERVDATQASLGDAGLAAPVHLLAGDIFAMPFGPDAFDLVYSSGLFHELDVKERGADDALLALRSVARSGGRVVTADFIDSEAAVQLEDEDLEAEMRQAAYGSRVYGIGPPERLISLHRGLFRGVRWRYTPPQEIRHLWKLVLAEGEPTMLSSLPDEVALRLRERRRTLRDRILHEGYTRPATLYVEGLVEGT